VLTSEDRLAAAGGLMLDAAPAIIAGIADSQAAGDYRRDIPHRRKIIPPLADHAMRTVVRSADALTPRGIRPARRAVDAKAAVLCSCKVFHLPLEFRDYRSRPAVGHVRRTACVTCRVCVARRPGTVTDGCWIHRRPEEIRIGPVHGHRTTYRMSPPAGDGDRACREGCADHQID